MLLLLASHSLTQTFGAGQLAGEEETGSLYTVASLPGFDLSLQGDGSQK